MTATSASHDRRWLALPVILAPIFMAILDVFIVNVAAPSLQRDLGTTPEQVEWIVAGYVLAYAVTLVTGGRIGDIYGRRRAFRVGVAGFTAASALCGAAPTPATLIAARVVQGLAAALMAPQVLSIIQVEFTAAERRRCLAVMGGVQGAAAICGQIIGGGLISLDVLGLGWRAVFLINVPVGLLALAASGPLVRESRSDQARRLDLTGAALGSVVLLGVVAPIVEGRSAGWPWWVPVSLLAAAGLGAVWVAHQRRLGARGGSPVVDLSLLELRTFRLGIALSLAFYIAVPAFLLIVGLYLQDGRGLTAIHSGLAFTPLAVAYVTSSLSAPRLFARAGDRLLAAGAAITAAGAGAVIVTVGSTPSVAALLPGLAVFGVGSGLVMPGIIHATLRGVPAAAAGSASGVLVTVQQVGAALGVAGAGTIYFAGLPGDFASAFQLATAWTVAAAGISAVLALILAGPTARMRAATSAAS
jgi:EmrB/QacA subfamily drug resistance transporter